VTAERCPACGEGRLGPPRLRGRDRLHGLPGEFDVATCGSCGAGATLPPATPDELGRFYPSGYGPYELPAGRLARVLSATVRRWQAWLALRSMPLLALAERAPGRAVDVGCGRGDLGATLIGLGWRVTGVEPSPEACAQAGERGLDARCGTLGEASLEPGAYDAVVFQHSLEHVADPAADVARAGGALRPGGVLAVTVPNHGGWQARRFGSRWYHLDLPRHRTHFDAGSLARLVRVAGLEVVSTSTSSSAVGLPASIQYALCGRCLFPEGLALRVASVLCAGLLPLTLLADRVGRGGDVLHLVARRA
jgi:SAM-dependent methyltransferase